MQKRIKKFIATVISIIIAIPVILLILFAFTSRGMSDLEIWHTTRLTNEFSADVYTDEYTFDDYMQQEDLMFKELKINIFDNVPHNNINRLNRFNTESICYPGKYSQDWNRSFELIPSKIIGGVLLIHGLSDSPYSMKYLARYFYEKGYYVLALRMPGHGTIPGQLNYVTCQDWLTATKMAARHVWKQLGKDQPFFLCGYSNGATISLSYTFDAINDSTLPVPDKLFLFSPAIGVTKFAALSNWLRRLSFIPYFKKSEWKDISPEYNPFKYSSFTLNASYESHILTRQVKQRIDELAKSGQTSLLPPIVSFQSIVDSTTIINDLIFQLYYKLAPKNNELVLFNLNERAGLEVFINQGYRESLNTLTKTEKTPFNITLITNKSPDSFDVVAMYKQENDTEFKTIDIKTAWPNGIYSLSHVSILFPPDDPLYGYNPPETEEPVLHLGNLEVRGEVNVLTISIPQLMRIKSNPFYDFMMEKVNEHTDS